MKMQVFETVSVAKQVIQCMFEIARLPHASGRQPQTQDVQYVPRRPTFVALE